MRIGVFGGTFDPPHLGHLLLAEQAREQLQLSSVLWVPAGDPWRKAGAFVSAAQHRVEMVRLAIEGNAAFAVDRGEVDRDGPSFTVDTLSSLSGQYPNDQLVFLLGADALRDLPNWRDAPRLLELCLLGAAARHGEMMGPAELDALLPSLGARVWWFQMPRIDIEATDLRERVRTGARLRYFVPPAVERYIQEKGLYTDS